MDEHAIVEKFKRFCASDFGKRVARAESEYVEKHLAGAKKILNVGCGIGSLEANLPGVDITGLDASKAMVVEARKHCDNAFVVGDASKLPFKSGSYDAVVAVTTLEFLEKPWKALAEMARVTKPGGRALLLLLNPHSNYFKSHCKKQGSYFRRVKHADLDGIRNWFSRHFRVEGREFILGIRGKRIFRTKDKRWASLYVLAGTKKGDSFPRKRAAFLRSGKALRARRAG